MFFDNDGEFCFWDVNNCVESIQKNTKFAEFSPLFSWPNNIEKYEWQMELCSSANQSEDTKLSSLKNCGYIELRLRLTQIFTSYEKFFVSILCILQNSSEQYLMMINECNSFCYPMNTSWHSKPIDAAEILQNLEDGTLRIKLKAEIFVGNFIDRMISDNTSIQIQNGLKELLKSGEHTDTAIVGIHGDHILVHYWVLLSRFPQFAHAVDKSPSTEEFKRIFTEMDKKSLSEFVKFTYDGTLSTTLDTDNIIQLFRVANKFCITCLQKMCEDLLITKFEVRNLVPILVFANDNDVICLKKRALEIIRNNKQKFTDENSFQDVKSPVLLQEIIDYTT